MSEMGQVNGNAWGWQWVIMGTTTGIGNVGTVLYTNTQSINNTAENNNNVNNGAGTPGHKGGPNKNQNSNEWGSKRLAAWGIQ